MREAGAKEIKPQPVQMGKSKLADRFLFTYLYFKMNGVLNLVFIISPQNSHLPAICQVEELGIFKKRLPINSEVERDKSPN